MGTESAMLVHLATSGIAEAVQSQAVSFKVHDGKQPAFEVFQTGQVELALKNGLLHSLAPSFTGLCHSTQPAAPFGVFSVDVVADDHQHREL